MPSGSCLCGNLKITYQGEPQVKALCHCTDCHKISGSTYSTNLVVSGEGFESTGEAKQFKKTADSGKNIVSNFCPNCGSTLWREGDAFPGMKVIKAGVLDDANALENAKPGVELFVAERPGWVQGIPGADEKNKMS